MLAHIANAPTDRAITILYHRLSSEEQACGAGLERQRAATSKWCRERGHAPEVRLEDVGYSAYTADHIRRGRMGKLLDAIEGGHIRPGSTIVMENLDRLTRQEPFDGMALVMKVLGRDIAIVTTCDSYRYARDGTALERMMSVILSAMHIGRGASESEVKATRVGDAWAGKKAAARSHLKPHGRRCPLWIELFEGAYRLVPDRGDEIALMVERATAGWGRRLILRDLKSRVPPWTKPTRKNPHPTWTDSYIQKMLTGCEIWGGYRPSSARKDQPRVMEDVIEGYYPAAVSRDAAAAARAAMAKRRGSGGPKGDFVNILRGIAKCGACGHGMTVVDKGVRSSGRKLVCQRHLLGACDHGTDYHLFVSEAATIFCIGGHADELVRSSESVAKEIERRLAGARAVLADVDESIGRIVERMKRIDDPALDAVLASLRSDFRKAEAEVARLLLEKSAAGQASGPASPHAITEFYARLAALSTEAVRHARLDVNQRLITIIDRIAFLDGAFTVHFTDGSEAWAEIPPLAPRPNSGRFVGGRRADGRQRRAGDDDRDTSDA